MYVDDLIITGDVSEEITQLKSNLCIHFRMKDLGRLSRFLSLELEYSSDGILLHQKKYATDVVRKFGILNIKPAPTPMDSGTKLYADLGKDVEDPTTYRKMVGSLIYLTLTRLDISFVVGVLSRYMQNPKQPHLNAICRVLCYVGSVGKGVLFKRESNSQLMGFCEAYYASDLDVTRSTTGYMLKYGSSPISWLSKLQPTVSLSTTKVECHCLNWGR